MGEIKFALQWAAVVSLVFGATWIWRARKDRSRGLVMAASFFVMAVMLYGLATEWPVVLLGILFGVLVVLLVVDFGMRAAKQAEKS